MFFRNTNAEEKKKIKLHAIRIKMCSIIINASIQKKDTRKEEEEEENELPYTPILCVEIYGNA